MRRSDFRRALTPLLDLRRRAVIDAELVACSDDGQPDFHALLRFGARSPVGLCLWCFDMMRLDGADLRRRPLIERQTRLAELLADVDDQGVQMSAAFEDGPALLKSAESLSYEGVVSKRVDSPYVSGRSLHWMNTKSETWRARTASDGSCSIVSVGAGTFATRWRSTGSHVTFAASIPCGAATTAIAPASRIGQARVPTIATRRTR